MRSPASIEDPSPASERFRYLRRPRHLLLGILLLGLAAAGCGSDDASAVLPGDAPGGGTGAGSLIDIDLGPFTPSDAGAAVISAATAEVQQEGEWSYTIVVRLPAGVLAEVTYTLDPVHRDLAPLAGTNTPLRAYDHWSEATPRGFEWRTEYVVPIDSLPADTFSVSEEGRGSLDGIVRGLLNPRTASASDGAGVQVVVRGVINEAGLDILGQLEGAETASGVDAVLNVISALDAGDEHRRAMRRLERLRACVERPGDSTAGRLRQQQYEAEPSAKQSDLDAIRRAEIEIKATSGVRFIGTMTGQAAGLVRWLGFVVGPATAWADSRAAYLIEEAVQELERRISGCSDGQWVWTGIITYETSWEERDEETSQTVNYIRPELVTDQHSTWHQESQSRVQIRIDGEPADGSQVMASYTAEVYEGLRFESNEAPIYYLCRGAWNDPDDRITIHERSERVVREEVAGGTDRGEIAVHFRLTGPLGDGRGVNVSVGLLSIDGTATETRTVEGGGTDACGNDRDRSSGGDARPWRSGISMVGSPYIPFENYSDEQTTFSGSDVRSDGSGKTTTVTWQLTREQR